MIESSIEIRFRREAELSKPFSSLAQTQRVMSHRKLLKESLFHVGSWVLMVAVFIFRCS